MMTKEIYVGLENLMIIPFCFIPTIMTPILESVSINVQ